MFCLAQLLLQCLEKEFDMWKDYGFFFFLTLKSDRHWLLHLLGEGDGIPLQSSCLENPMDGGDW